MVLCGLTNAAPRNVPHISFYKPHTSLPSSTEKSKAVSSASMAIHSTSTAVASPVSVSTSHSVSSIVPSPVFVSTTVKHHQPRPTHTYSHRSPHPTFKGHSPVEHRYRPIGFPHHTPKHATATLASSASTTTSTAATTTQVHVDPGLVGFRDRNSHKSSLSVPTPVLSARRVVVHSLDEDWGLSSVPVEVGGTKRSYNPHKVPGKPYNLTPQLTTLSEDDIKSYYALFPTATHHARHMVGRNAGDQVEPTQIAEAVLTTPASSNLDPGRDATPATTQQFKLEPWIPLHKIPKNPFNNILHHRRFGWWPSLPPPVDITESSPSKPSTRPSTEPDKMKREMILPGYEPEDDFKGCNFPCIWTKSPRGKSIEEKEKLAARGFFTPPYSHPPMYPSSASRAGSPGGRWLNPSAPVHTSSAEEGRRCPASVMAAAVAVAVALLLL